jgi:hypothetical protein
MLRSSAHRAEVCASPWICVTSVPKYESARRARPVHVCRPPCMTMTTFLGTRQHGSTATRADYSNMHTSSEHMVHNQATTMDRHTRHSTRLTAQRHTRVTAQGRPHIATVSSCQAKSVNTQGVHAGLIASCMIVRCQKATACMVLQRVSDELCKHSL